MTCVRLDASFDETNHTRTWLTASRDMDRWFRCFSDYRQYRNCTRETRLECKRGVQLMYEQDGNLRSLMLKLDYICKESKAGMLSRFLLVGGA